MGRGLAAAEWRSDLRRKIAILLAVKVVALIALKMLFFSGDARVTPSPTLLEAQLSLPQGRRAEAMSRETTSD